MTNAERHLLAVVAELDDLHRLERRFVEQRAELIRLAIDEFGWKHVAVLLGVGKSRVYAMIRQGRIQ